MISRDDQLRRIQDKLQQLLKQHLSIKKENQRLREDILSAQAQVVQQKKNVDELRQQVSILKLGAAAMNETDKKEFDKRINGYLKEIDRCIALIGE